MLRLTDQVVAGVKNNFEQIERIQLASPVYRWEVKEEGRAGPVPFACLLACCITNLVAVIIRYNKISYRGGTIPLAESLH